MAGRGAAMMFYFSASAGARVQVLRSGLGELEARQSDR